MPYGRRLTKMQDNYTPEQLWILIRRYEALILKLLEQLETHREDSR
jgi:hypothetical protein